MAQSQDTEITLGTGKLLGIFFALVIVCAVFFGLGYSLGRGTGKSAAGADLLASQIVSAKSNGEKPPAAKTAEGCAGDDCGQPADGSDLTFYKSVEQSQPEATLEKPEAIAPQAESKPAPEMARVAGYVVQIAAVSKQEDANALVEALRKKQYPVFTTTEPSDKLFHVQIGPFAEMKDAEGMKQRLMGDGYNAIVKR